MKFINHKESSTIFGIMLTAVISITLYFLIFVWSSQPMQHQSAEAEIIDRLDDMSTWINEDVNGGRLNAEMSPYYLQNIRAIRNLITNK